MVDCLHDRYPNLSRVGGKILGHLQMQRRGHRLVVIYSGRSCLPADDLQAVWHRGRSSLTHNAYFPGLGQSTAAISELASPAYLKLVVILARDVELLMDILEVLPIFGTRPLRVNSQFWLLFSARTRAGWLVVVNTCKPCAFNPEQITSTNLLPMPTP